MLATHWLGKGRVLAYLRESRRISNNRFLGSREVVCSASQCLQEAITPQAAQQLRQEGFAIVDNVFGDTLSQTLLTEIQSIRDDMHRNHTHFIRAGERKLLEKSSIYEADLLQPETFAKAAQYAKIQQDTGFRTMLSLFLPQLRLDAQAIKLQYNSGQGGCFPIHLDSDETVDSRRVTAIVYLNRNWRKGHGGELRLYPSWTQHVDIAPVNDRLVVFSSCRMPHRVLPTSEERYCFTIWLSQTRAAAYPPKPLHTILTDLCQTGPVEVEEVLKEPELRKALTKLAYADEWAKSLQDSHPDTEARAIALENFERERKILFEAVARVFPDTASLLAKTPTQHDLSWL